MIRRLFFLLMALSSACSLFTDFDGLTGGSAGGDASDASDASDVLVIEAAVVEAAVCASGQDFSADAKNCGSCGHDCLGGACLVNSCQAVMLAADIKTDHIRLDPTYAYFADSLHGAIKRIRSTAAPSRRSPTASRSSTSSRSATTTSTTRARSGFAA